MTFHHIATGMLCYGPVIDGDQHLALTESWLPAGTGLEDRFNGDRDAACAELLDRYLTRPRDAARLLLVEQAVPRRRPSGVGADPGTFRGAAR